jgi:hypothetical protein
VSDRIANNTVRAAMLGIVALVTRVDAGPITINPIPLNSVLAIFGSDSGGYYSFDPNTHIFSSSEPIVGVQFLNQVLSFTDPLVNANNTLTINGIFTGSAISPLSQLDTTGVWTTATTSIMVGGRLAFSYTFSNATFDAIFYGTNSADAEWSAATYMVTFEDPSLIALSPFLSIYAHDTINPPPGSPDTSWHYTQTDRGLEHSGTSATRTLPEPNTLYETGMIIVMLLCWVISRSVRSRILPLPGPEVRA